MANANSMGGLCISFDTECRNSLSLKGLKRALKNALVYDIKKELVEYDDALKEFFNIICYNNSGEEIIINGEDKNTTIEYDDDNIVATTTLTTISTGTFLVNIVNRKEIVTEYLDASVIDYSGNVFRYRGGTPFESVGQLYCSADNYDNEKNKVGGFVRTINLLNCGVSEENLVNYLIELDLNVAVGKDDSGHNVYEKHTFFVPIAGNNKGKFYSTLEEAAAANL